ncbi:hypothetical protein V6N11_025345 [Hibiscus sabdariffa]|uniref:Uncharacterized protein n=2 Tax=Hibiscus sabdariffa TaxID=183260 RepID=A0ABR2G6T9_9ROSI
MAVDLHDPAFFIPSSPLQNTTTKLHLFASSESGSELSSPSGSDHLGLSSTTTDSSEEEEEEDCFTDELTRQMAQYMLQDEDKHEKSSGSPLVEKFETATYSHGFQSKQELIDEQIRAIQFYKLKQEQEMKQKEQKPRTNHHQSKGKVPGGINNGYKVPINSNNTPWYTLQQQQQQSKKQTGSDMRPVFLTGSCSRNGSGGTGVFLPRGTGGIPCNPRKKKGCATVLIPARVVQALKLHFEKTGVSSRFNTTDFKDADACDSMESPQKGRSGAVAGDTSQHGEVRLPQEWTY